MSSDVLSQSDVQIQHTECFINGEWVPAQSGKTFATVNPATEEEIAQIAEGDAEDVNLAAIAARKAFDEGPWSKMDAPVRPCPQRAGWASLVVSSPGEKNMFFVDFGFLWPFAPNQLTPEA